MKPRLLLLLVILSVIVTSRASLYTSCTDDSQCTADESCWYARICYPLFKRCTDLGNHQYTCGSPEEICKPALRVCEPEMPCDLDGFCWGVGRCVMSGALGYGVCHYDYVDG